MADWLSSSAGGSLRFETTQWSMISGAAAKDERNRAAFEDLYRSYCHPVYAFIRRRGYARQDAQDLTQDFFLHLADKNAFVRADPNRGKFRNFLLGSLQLFLQNVEQRARTEKRGGHATMIFLDDETCEEKYQLADSSLSAEQVFDVRWAATQIQAAVNRLRTEMETAGKADLFEQIRSFLLGGDDSSQQEVAQRVGLTPGAVKVTIHRMRARYRELLRAEIARTVVSSGDFEEELRALWASLQSGYLPG